MIQKRDGTKYVCDLPSWADAHVRIGLDITKEGSILVITHPNYPPHFYNEQAKKWEKL